MLSQCVFPGGTFESSANAERIGCGESLVMPSANKLDVGVAQSLNTDPVYASRVSATENRSLSLSVSAYERVIQDFEQEFDKVSLGPKLRTLVGGEYERDLAFLKGELRRVRSTLAESRGELGGFDSIDVWAQYPDYMLAAKENERATQPLVTIQPSVRVPELQDSEFGPMHDDAPRHSPRRVRRELVDVAS
jgi:hypothetical protein